MPAKLLKDTQGPHGECVQPASTKGHMANLTVSLVTKTRATDREGFLSDTKIPGLGIRVPSSVEKDWEVSFGITVGGQPDGGLPIQR